ncbi:MAG: hypothetical protein AMJ60_05785 [Desulfobacterales bacterium SG8_35]|nr:MAG: hypothetical protein AMJ60_05785 [Desulfobacterales bacterium SG8_35]
MSVFVLRSYHDWEPATTFKSIPKDVDLALENIQYTKTHNGKTLWTLVADSAAHSMEDSIIRIENIRMVFFDSDMGDIVLTADQGEIIPQNKTVKVRSNVTVASTSGKVMQTEYLEYIEATNSLHTDKMVRMNFDHFTVSGKGMKMDIEKRIIYLSGSVKALLGG